MAWQGAILLVALWAQSATYLRPSYGAMWWPCRFLMAGGFGRGWEGTYTRSDKSTKKVFVKTLGVFVCLILVYSMLLCVSILCVGWNLCQPWGSTTLHLPVACKHTTDCRQNLIRRKTLTLFFMLQKSLGMVPKPSKLVSKPQKNGVQTKLPWNP